MVESALQEEIDALRVRYRSGADPSGRTFAPLADAYRRAGEMEEAWTLVQEGLDRLPEFATGHLVAARILRDRGDRDGAAEAYGRVLALDEGNSDALREAAALARGDGRTVEALRLLQRLSLLDPADRELRERIHELKELHFGGGAAPEKEPWRAEEDRSGAEEEPWAARKEQRGAREERWGAEEEQPGAEEDRPGPSLLEDEPPADVETPSPEDETGAEVEVLPEDEARTEVEPSPEDGAGTEVEPSPEDEAGAEVELPSEDEARVEEDEAGVDADLPSEAEVSADVESPHFDGEEEDEEPVAGGRDEPARPEVLTRTMAELYARQGHLDRALKVYRHLVERRPEDDLLHERMLELERTARAARADPHPGVAAADLDVLAEEWLRGPEDHGDLATPFAWGEDDATSAGDAAGDDSPTGASVSAYFASLLTWEQGGESGPDGERSGTEVERSGTEIEQSGAEVEGSGAETDQSAAEMDQSGADVEQSGMDVEESVEDADEGDGDTGDRGDPMDPWA